MAIRTLLLLRHAKSSWDDPSLDDFDRPLARRGREAAPRVGREMARRGLIPQMAIVSPALRTRQTWDLVSAGWPLGPDTTFDPTVYEAEPEAILRAIRAVPDRIQTLLVVGHNPGLEQLSLAIAGDGSNRDAVSSIETKYPTAALAIFHCADTWSRLAGRSCRLVDFITPRSLP